MVAVVAVVVVVVAVVGMESLSAWLPLWICCAGALVLLLLLPSVSFLLRRTFALFSTFEATTAAATTIHVLRNTGGGCSPLAPQGR